MSYTIEWDKSGIIQTHYGTVDFNEIDTANRKLYGDPRIKNVRYYVWDATNVDHLILNKKEIAMISAEDIGGSHYVINIKFAIIANKPEIQSTCQSYIDFLSKFTSGWKFRIFNSLDEGKKWAQAYQGCRKHSIVDES